MEVEVIKLNQIELSLSYEGYLWMSNCDNPLVLNGERLNFLPKEDENPFIVEGNLFCKPKSISYSIKYVDGEYIVRKYQLSPNDRNKPNEEICYLANRMDDKDSGNRWLKFIRFWEKIPDDNCLGLPVLTFTKEVFIGFK